MKTTHSANLVSFEPWPGVRGGDAQTVLGTISWPRLPKATQKLWIPLPDGASLTAYENRPAQGDALAVVLLMHGLAGHAGMPYMVRAARRLTAAGFAAVRLNHRGAGSGVGLSPKLYCSAMSDDVQAVLDFLAARFTGRPLAAVGYSMSGNVLMRYLGERPSEASRSLQASIAINPALDLCATMDSLEQPRNRLYHDLFVRQLIDQALSSTGAAGRDLCGRLDRVRTVRQFDHVLTSRDWGYSSAEDYYEKASALLLADRIEVPTLVIADEDDPIVPPNCVTSARFSSEVELVVTRGGGHLGYLSRQLTPFGDRRWMDYAVVEGLKRWL